MTGKVFLFFLTAGICALPFLPTAAEDAKPVHATQTKPANLNVKITEQDKKDAEAAAKQKKAVMMQMMQLFLDRKPPVTLATHPISEQAKPDVKIVAGTNGMSTLIYRCRYVDPDFLTDSMEAVITDAGSVELVKKLGSDVNEYSQIVIYDKTEKMNELKNVLLAMDVSQPQVLVEAQVIELYSDQGAERDVNLKYSYAKDDGSKGSIGMNMDSPSQSRDANQGGTMSFTPMYQSGGTTHQLNMTIRMLNTSQTARILSAPTIVADQGAEATITTAEELPIPETTALTSSTNLSFKFKQVGVTLKITPNIINEKTVQLTVSPQVRSVLRYEQFIQNSVSSYIPVISVRSVNTRLTVSDGDIIALGGLYNSEKTESLRKVPYIGNIPMLGDLFNGRDSGTVDKQLLFLLKVHIITPFQPKMFDVEDDSSAVHQLSKILDDSRKIFTNKPAAEFVDIENALNEKAKDMGERRKNEISVYEELKRIISGKVGEMPSDGKVEQKPAEGK